jgi:catalase
VKFTNAAGLSVFVRYQFVPRAGEHYLTPEQRKAESASYSQDEILQRVGLEFVAFDWYAQIAEQGDAIADPSTAWPDTRKLVKLRTFSITGRSSDPATADRTLLFLPGQAHLGVEAADPMLMMRNTAHPFPLGQRQ